MKKCLMLAVAVAIVGLVCLPVLATVNLQLPPDAVGSHPNNKMKLVDVTSHFRDGDPLEPQAELRGGEELRGLFSLTDLVSPPSDTVAYWSAASSSEEVTGLIYDLVLSSVGGTGLDSNGLPQTGTILYYSPLGRNPLQLADDQFGPGGVADIGAFVAGGGIYGGVVELYNGSTQNLGILDDTDPNDWQANGSAVSHTPDTFPNASDGTPWLSGVFLDLQSMGMSTAPAGAVYMVQFIASATTANGYGFINVFGGSQSGVVVPWSFAPYLDATLANTIYLLPTGNWQADSNDPILLDVAPIPEPTIMLLFGASIVGGLIRRKF